MQPPEANEPTLAKWWQHRWVGWTVLALGLLERFVGWGGSIDFLLARWSDPGWVGKVMQFFSAQSEYFGLALTFGGIVLIVRNERRRVDLKLGTAKLATPAQEASRNEKLAAIASWANESFKAIGYAAGSDMPMAYDLAVTQCEAMLLELSRRNDLEIPELRKDGTKAGALRAMKYLSELLPLLQLEDDDGARKRAAVLVPELNGLDAKQLADALGIAPIAPVAPPVATPIPDYTVDEFAEELSKAGLPQLTGDNDSEKRRRLALLISDLVATYNLPVWGRQGNLPIDRIDLSVWKRSNLGFGPNGAVLGYINPMTRRNVWIEDLQLNLSSIKELDIQLTQILKAEDRTLQLPPDTESEKQP